MASDNEIQFLAGKALFDAKFRSKLLANPAKTAKSLGIDLDPDQLKTIQGIKRSELRKLASQARQVIYHTGLKNAQWSG